MKPLVLASIPGLRQCDLAKMPHAQKLFANGKQTRLSNSFPAVTWPSQSNMLTGTTAKEHGVVANGFFWREENKVEMWTAWNEVIQQPQLWDVLREQGITSAAWFPMLSKGCGADYVCMPAPIHKPDGSEDMWCYSKPQSFYGDLLEKLGHFPLKHFWGPLANIKSSQWIVQSATMAVKEFQPQFFYIYLPHLDYAAQKFGPDSPQAVEALTDLDNTVAEMIEGFAEGYDDAPEWVFASEYVITPVNHVTYPNRSLRELGLIKFTDASDGEYLDTALSAAWALVDHQFSHVFVKDHDLATIKKVVDHFSQQEGIQSVLTGSARGALDHERSGDVILLSTPNSWQAYYWWEDDSKAPSFAPTVDIHRKPGYDPVELHFDMATMSVPLDADLIKGSHGYGWTGPADSASGSGQDHRGVFLSTADLDLNEPLCDTDIKGVVLGHFGIDG